MREATIRIRFVTDCAGLVNLRRMRHLGYLPIRKNYQTSRLWIGKIGRGLEDTVCYSAMTYTDASLELTCAINRFETN